MMKTNLRAGMMAAFLVISLTACGSNEAQPVETEKVQVTETKVETKEKTEAVTENIEEVYVPDGTFNIRVFAAAGGVADTVTRITAQSLQDTYGITPVINNLTGANGAIAAADMDSYEPSINELSLVSMSLFTMSPLMNPDLNVSIDNYEIVGSLIRDEFVLLVSKDSGIKSWEDLVEYGKENKIIYASNAPGGGTHLVQCGLFGDAGLNAEALTSDGSNKDILAVMSGDAICTSATVTLAKSYVESGDLIPIGIFSDNVYTGYEGYEVPTVPSFGYDITIPSYNFLITRAGVEPEEVKGFYEAIETCRETDAFKEAAEAASYVPDHTDGETLRAEIEKYAKDSKEIFDKYY